MRDLRLLLALSLLATGLASPSAQAFQSGWSTKTVVDLGTYRVATGEWIPPTTDDPLVANSLYDNTCIPGSSINAVQFTGPQEIVVDTGQIPGSDNTLFGIDPSLLHAEYVVQGWRWAISPAEPDLPGEPDPITATIYWWDCLDSCLQGGSFTGVNPTASISIDGIPAGGSSNSCFVFNVDITGTALEFHLTGDCDGVFDGPGAGAIGDTFGYGISVQRTDGQPLTNTVSIGMGGDPGTQSSGFGCQLANGNPGPAGFIGESTRFLNASRHADSSTGFGNGDDFMDAQGGTLPGCFSFGYFIGLPGIPHVGLFHELYGEPAFESVFPERCNGDGGDQQGCSDCPCANNATAGTIGGCLNSTGNSARLQGSGTPSVSADTLRFELTGAPPTAFTILNSGDQVAPANMANPCFGQMSGVQASTFDGLRCAVMNTRRHGGRPADANGNVGLTNNGWGPPSGPPIGLIAQGGFVAGQTRHYQVIYREDPLAGCMRGLNTSQAVSVLFVP